MHDSFVTHNSSSWQGEPPLSRGGFILLSAVMALFTGPAVVLNATVIIVSLLHKQLRQPLNYALVNMAVADLGSAVTGGLLSVVHNAQGFSSLGRTGCVMEGFAVSLFGITSLCTVALIAVERMFVVCKPLGHMTFQKKHALAAIALSWIWSLTWNVPPLLGWGRYELEGVGTSCAPDWRNRDPHHMSYILVYFAVCFAVPFVVILVSYSRLMWTLHQVSKLACLEGGAVAKKELKVASMVVLMVLTFLISWLPYAVPEVCGAFPAVQRGEDPGRHIRSCHHCGDEHQQSVSSLKAYNHTIENDTLLCTVCSTNDNPYSVNSKKNIHPSIFFSLIRGRVAGAAA
ncbi:parapinopsin b isoform X1 [Entelurus aequoreus]|uniref:parapinopsin b isoform X1 n=1 Tax=Entelurus aequoreus TaxID=161455 RepID=UPI002B1D9C28|nr:parapinopsin b isoform X1 [Entelurus aequoreus]